MDNLCHTLAGAAFGEAGLQRRTRFGNATLMIAANLPDIDVLAFATSTPAVALRRGWTHGVVAQALLPLALAGIVWAIGRRTSHPRASDAPRPSHESHPRTSFVWLLALSYVGVLSHVGLDWLNSYGVRLLAPLDWRWLYGDAVFIIDPGLWLLLGLGVWLARKRAMPRAAQAAVVVAALYVAALVAGTQLWRRAVTEQFTAATGVTPRVVMVAPRPLTLLTRDVIVDAGDRYYLARFSWPDRSLRFNQRTLPKNDGDPRVRVARNAPNIQAFLVFARFPYWYFEELADGTRVSVSDARFNFRTAFVESTVVPRVIAPN